MVVAWYDYELGRCLSFRYEAQSLAYAALPFAPSGFFQPSNALFDTTGTMTRTLGFHHLIDRTEIRVECPK